MSKENLYAVTCSCMNCEFVGVVEIRMGTLVDAISVECPGCGCFGQLNKTVYKPEKDDKDKNEEGELES